MNDATLPDVFRALAMERASDAYRQFNRTISCARDAQLVYARAYCDALLMFYYHDPATRETSNQRLRRSHFGLVIGLISGGSHVWQDRGGGRGVKGMFWGTRNWVQDQDAYGFIHMLGDHLKLKFGNQRNECFSYEGLVASLKTDQFMGPDETIYLLRALSEEARIDDDEGVDVFVNAP